MLIFEYAFANLKNTLLQLMFFYSVIFFKNTDFDILFLFHSRHIPDNTRTLQFLYLNDYHLFYIKKICQSNFTQVVHTHVTCHEKHDPLEKSVVLHLALNLALLLLPIVLKNVMYYILYIQITFRLTSNVNV